MYRRLRSALRELWHLRAARGPYRYLVRRWDDISDIDLATRVLATQFFEKELAPVALPLSTVRTMVVLAPHQDDEVLGAGGTMLLAAKAGAVIHVVYVTDGVQSETPYATSPAHAAEIRNSEAEQVCSAIGAEMHHLGISNLSPYPTLDDVDRLADLLIAVNPQVLLAPWILDSPAKHRLVNHLLWAAARKADLPPFEVWGYQVHNTLLPNGYVDITAVARAKRSLLECFRSQNEFSQCYDHLGMAMSAWNSRFLPGSSAHRFVEVFFTLPLIEFARLIERFYFRDLRQTYRGSAHLLPGVTAFHKSVTQLLRYKI